MANFEKDLYRLGLLKSKIKLTLAAKEEMKWAKRNFKKAKLSNKEKHNMILYKTWQYRRYKLVFEDYTPMNIMTDFPALYHPEMIKKEFNRVMFFKNKLPSLQKKLKPKLDAAMAEVEDLIKNGEDLKKNAFLEKGFEIHRDNPYDDIFQNVLGMLCLCVVKLKEVGLKDVILWNLKENEEKGEKKLKMILSNKSLYELFNLHPLVRIPIYFEGNEISYAPNFYEGVILIYSLFHIFSIKLDSILFKEFNEMLKFVDITLDIIKEVED